MSTSGSFVALSSGPSTLPWPGPARAPLPAMPPITATQPNPPQAGCWANAPYTATLTSDWPTQPDLYWHRGNFCIRVPDGVPYIYPGNPVILTWDLVQYGAENQAKFLAMYAGDDSYTHIDLSIPQTKNAGKSMQDLIDCAVLCKSYGQFVTVNVFGGDGETFADVQPWLDALVAAEAVDILCVCWQADRWYDPLALMDITCQVALYAKDHGLLTSIHWINEACAWWNASDDPRQPNTCSYYGICNRFDYQAKLGHVSHDTAVKMAARLGSAYLALEGQTIPTFHYQQVDTNAPIDEIQSAESKVLLSLAGQRLVMSEDDAQSQFDDPTNRTELYGDQKGYLCCCQDYPDQFPVTYLNGARRPDGLVL